MLNFRNCPANLLRSFKHFENPFEEISNTIDNRHYNIIENDFKNELENMTQ